MYANNVSSVSNVTNRCRENVRSYDSDDSVCDENVDDPLCTTLPSDAECDDEERSHLGLTTTRERLYQPKKRPRMRKTRLTATKFA